MWDLRATQSSSRCEVQHDLGPKIRILSPTFSTHEELGGPISHDSQIVSKSTSIIVLHMIPRNVDRLMFSRLHPLHPVSDIQRVTSMNSRQRYRTQFVPSCFSRRPWTNQCLGSRECDNRRSRRWENIAPHQSVIVEPPRTVSTADQNYGSLRRFTIIGARAGDPGHWSVCERASILPR